ncbi:hypothetical protein BOTU111922_22840 [Bordetella tumulicola]
MNQLSIQDLTNDVNLHFKGPGYVKKLIGNGSVSAPMRIRTGFRA